MRNQGRSIRSRLSFKLYLSLSTSPSPSVLPHPGSIHSLSTTPAQGVTSKCPALYWAQWVQRQADRGPILQKQHVDGKPGQSQFQQRPWHSGGSHWHMSSPTGSLALSRAFLIVLRPHTQDWLSVHAVAAFMRYR